ncbi:quinone oxidoreductase family protein [Salipiger abyssi]|uniref:quinone oxidoreductase family protein n=1 Tax=Salipiger abyssi TaxID=1250539 RepID=UPI004057D810
MEQAFRLVTPGREGRLQRIDWEPGAPGPGTLRIRQERIGVNFIDSYFRTGLYPLPDPAIPGVEGGGVVEAVGDGVSGFAIGQRVAYCAQPGGFATQRLLPAWRALPLPNAIGAETAAASMLRGMTAHMLLSRVHRVGPQSTVLIQAAAGGLGGLLTQWAKALGATVIGTVSTPEKAEIATRLGADHVITGRDAALVPEIEALTEGAGVDFAIDGVGGDRLRQSIACTRADGTVASIGQAAGESPALTVAEIAPRRMIRFARPSIMAFAADPEAYRAAGAAVFEMIGRGIAVAPARIYPFAEAAEALAALESGQGTGASILTT